MKCILLSIFNWLENDELHYKNDKIKDVAKYFDDIIDQNRMKGEHNLLSSILDAWTDNNNFSVINLAMEVLKSKDLRNN